MTALDTGLQRQTMHTCTNLIKELNVNYPNDVALL